MTASLENCKRLYELSGWNDSSLKGTGDYMASAAQANQEIPAYTAGYLLDKLAPLAKEVGRLSLEYCNTDDGWMWYIGYNDLADNTPSITHPDKTDAACLLTIKLFETGVLKK